MDSAPRPRGFFGRRIFQLRHAPKPVFRAVFANVSVATLLTLAYLVYDLQVERMIRSGADLGALVGGRDLRTEAAALVVIGTVIVGSALTYLIVPQPRANGVGSERSGWSALLGLFASLPVAYIALVVESQLLKPLFAGL